MRRIIGKDAGIFHARPYPFGYRMLPRNDWMQIPLVSMASGAWACRAGRKKRQPWLPLHVEWTGAYPQVPTAPQAVQKSQPSLRIIVWLPHSGQAAPCMTLGSSFSRGVSSRPISRVG